MGLKLVKAKPEQEKALKDAHQDAHKDKRGGGSGGAGGGVFSADGGRVVRHDPGRLPDVLDEIGLALAEFCTQGGNLFRWGAGLSRVYVVAEDSESRGVKRTAGAVTLHSV